MSNTPTNQAPLDEFDARCMQGAELVDAGKFHEAAEIFRDLCSRPTVGDSTRAVMAVNLATVYDKMGHTDTALQTHEYAASIVQAPYVFAEEARATYLFKIGRKDDAASIWEMLLSLLGLPDDARSRIEQNLATARGH